jgi:alkylation response protein AidB-like acyl-CoA dehydrogenase
VWPELRDHADMCAVLEELGRVRCPLPVQAGLVQVDAALAALGPDSTDGAHHRRQLLTGSRRYGIGMHDVLGQPAPDHVSVAAGQDSDGRWYLSGTVRDVSYGDSAQLLLVPAEVGARLLLAVVSADARGVTRVCRQTMSGDRRGDFEFSYTPLDEGSLLAGGSARDHRARRALVNAHATGVMALCAESVGLGAGLLQRTVERVKSRRAFGGPLAALQSVQLRVADMYLDLIAARAAVTELATLLPDGDEIAVRSAVADTKITVTEATLRIAAGAHQLCGGWGQLDEAGLHHYTRAIKAAEGLLGSPAYHRRVIAQLLAV